MGEVKALVVPYKTFKERIKQTKRFNKDYYVENMDGYLYLVRR